MEPSHIDNRTTIENGVRFFKTFGKLALVINVAGAIFKACNSDSTFVIQVVGAAASVTGIMSMDKIARTFDEYARK